MTTKNLEKLAEIGERKLFDDLDTLLIEIKQKLKTIQRTSGSTEHQKNYLNEKIESYKNLIATCKNYGVNVNEHEKNYSQINYSKLNIKK